MKGVTNKGLDIELVPNQSNAMETCFTRLEELVTSMASSMVTQVKPTTFAPGDFSAQGFDLGFFWGLESLGH